MPGSPGTTNSDHIRGAGATAKRQCKPSLTPSHSPGRNHWPPDVGQTQPFRHQTGHCQFKYRLVQVMADPLRHRQTKGAATDMVDLRPPRHIPTLPGEGIRPDEIIDRPRLAPTSQVDPKRSLVAGYRNGEAGLHFGRWPETGRVVSSGWNGDIGIRFLSELVVVFS